MNRILVLSDIHYPLPQSELFSKIIKLENPTKIILLGDIIEPYDQVSALDLYKEFFDKFSNIFPTKNTVILIGDNDGLNSDYTVNLEIKNYLDHIPKINSDILNYKYKNLFFFHGNIESSYFQESVGKYAALGLAAINKNLPPMLVAKGVRKVFNLKENDIAMLGHIHYLNIIGNNIFCGTLCERKIIYSKHDSLGYVLINDNEGENIKTEDITLVRLYPDSKSFIK